MAQGGPGGGRGPSGGRGGPGGGRGGRGPGRRGPGRRGLGRPGPGGSGPGGHRGGRRGQAAQSATPGRVAAHGILAAFLRRPRPLHWDRLEALDPRERALARQLVVRSVAGLSVLRSRLLPFLSRPWQKLHPTVRASLLLGACQLLLLDGIAPHAAVDQSVRLTRSEGQPKAAGLVNAVLRRVAEAPAPPVPVSAHAQLVQVHGLPDWMAARWCARFGGDEALARAGGLLDTPPLTLWCRDRDATRLALAEAGIEAQPTPDASRGLWLPERPGAIARLPSYAKGAFQVQDEAAQLVGALIAPLERGRAVDLCAAPGGKTVQLAARCGAEVELHAWDISAKRLPRLRKNLARMGLGERVQVTARDAVSAPATGTGSEGSNGSVGHFDRVLLDAPCSGLGTLRRHPELRWLRQPADLVARGQLQEELLTAALRLLAPGGELVYAVCSPAEEEGAEVVARTLARTPGVQQVDIATRHPELAGLCEEGALRTDRAPRPLDGFYAALLVKA